MQRDMGEAERAEKEAAVATSRAQEAVNRAERTRDSVAAATASPTVRNQGVNSRSERPGDADFLDGSVQFMASSPRKEFSTELGSAVIAKASNLLPSVMKTSLPPPELLSARRAWSPCLLYTSPSPRD